MKFYFFETMLADRGKGPQPTLRALSGQTFEDGTPVRTDINVQAPKEKGSAIHGSRLDYPVGTVFCSCHLEMKNPDGKMFYSVYADEEVPTANADIEFYPVSDDPNFAWLKPEHKSDRMNIGYTMFKTFGTADAGEPDKKPAASSRRKGKAKGGFGPADRDGISRPADSAWQPSYEDQVENTSEAVVSWMKHVLNDMNITTMKKRPKADSAIHLRTETLLRCGESTDTIASQKRFMDIMKVEKMDAISLKSISKGPMEWYLDILIEEHRSGQPTTFKKRDPSNAMDIEDAAWLICSENNRQMGSSALHDTPEAKQAVKDILTKGWKVDDVLAPDVISAKGSYPGLLSALNSGEITMPNHKDDGTPLIDRLLEQDKYRLPSEKDGFFVDEKTWRILIINLYRKRHTLITGPTGSGKTEIVKRLCEQAGLPLTIIPMGTITDPTEQLIGKMDLDPATQGTRFDWADFALAIQRPGVILLDEINRCPRNGNNTLFSVLDGTEMLVASGAKSTDQRQIKVNPDVVFFATANIGDTYTDTHEMDEALTNRFGITELNYLPVQKEAEMLTIRTGIDMEDANNIALVAKNVRDSAKTGTISTAVSTRETLLCAEYVKDGFDVAEALEATFLPKFAKGEGGERSTVKAMIASRFNNKKNKPKAS